MTPSLGIKPGPHWWEASALTTAGHKINFFFGSHLAPKYFKVVANSKKIGCHLILINETFFTLCYKEDTRMGHIQC